MDALVNAPELAAAVRELESAEDFLDYFGIAHDPAVVHVNRLHILQRLHDYLRQHAADASAPTYAEYRQWLLTAYEDFVKSDALTEKVFKVFRMNEPQTVFVPLSEVFR